MLGIGASSGRPILVISEYILASVATGLPEESLLDRYGDFLYNRMFTGPIQHDPLIDFIVFPVMVIVLVLIWKYLNLDWPDF